MRQPTHTWKAYVLLKDEVMLKLPDKIDIFSIKKEFQMMITSKGRFERISPVNQLFKELERQLIINPDKNGIHEFYSVLLVLNALHPQAIELDLLTKVANHAKNCMPLPPRKDRLTLNIRNMLAIELVMCSGKDWEHFAMALGISLKEKNPLTYSRVRIKPGEFNNIDHQLKKDIPLILNTVLTLFEDRCMKFGVKMDLLDHIINLLERKEIFGTSMIADKIKNEKNIMETFAMALGLSLKEKDAITYSRVRITVDELNNIEQKINGDIPRSLNSVLTLFEDRCLEFEVKMNLLDHIIDIPKRKEIFGTSTLANKIQKEKDMMENF